MGFETQRPKEELTPEEIFARKSDVEKEEYYKMLDEPRQRRIAEDSTLEGRTARIQRGIQEMLTIADTFDKRNLENSQGIATEDMRALRARMMDFVEQANPGITDEEVEAAGQYYEEAVRRVGQSQNNQEVLDIVKEAAREASQKLSSPHA